MMSTVEIKQQKKRNLNRKRIVAAAFDVLDEHGLDGMSLRSIAEKLEVQAPALYKHFKNKDDVLIEMTQALIDIWWDKCTKIEDTKWQPWLTECSGALRMILCSHRDGPRLFVMYHSYTSTSLTRDITTMLHAQGFSPNEVIPAASTLISFVIGFTLEEDFEHHTKRIAKIKIGEGVDPIFFEGAHDYDLQFKYGVERILKGIAAR